MPAATPAEIEAAARAMLAALMSAHAWGMLMNGSDNPVWDEALAAIAAAKAAGIEPAA